MNDVIKVLEQVAAKLGVAVEYLWEVLVRQQTAEGITNLIVAIILLIFIIAIGCVASRVTKHYSNKYETLRNERIKRNIEDGYTHLSSYEENEARNMAKDTPWVAVFIDGLMIIFFVTFTIIGVQKLINPEYFAIKEIMNAIGGTIG